MEYFETMKLVIAVLVIIVVCSANHHHHGDYHTIYQDNTNNTHPKRQVGLAIASAGALASMLYQHHISKKILNTKPHQSLGLAIPGIVSNKLEDYLNSSTPSNPIASSGRANQESQGSQSQASSTTSAVAYQFTYDKQTGQGSVSGLSSSGSEPPTRPPNIFKKMPPQDKVLVVDDDISIVSKASSSERSVELQIVYPDLTNENFGHFTALARVRFQDVRGKLPRQSLESSLDFPNILENPLTLSRHPQNLVLARGIEWSTPGIKNSCVIDSFLTYLCIRQQRQPGFADRYFLLDTPAERSLAEIFRIYRSNTGSLIGKNVAIKVEWLKHLNLRPESDGNYNLAGTEAGRVMIPLGQSSAVVSIYVCLCRTSNEEKIKGKSVIATNFNLVNSDDIREFARNSGVVSEPVTLGKSSAFKCSKCDQERNFLFNFVSSGTWYIYFTVYRSTDWDIHDIPTNIRINEADVPGQVAVFDLGYISYTNRIPGVWNNHVLHLTSLQRHGRSWYYYDDMNEGRLIIVPRGTVNNFISQKRLQINSIVYFRR